MIQNVQSTTISIRNLKKNFAQKKVLRGINLEANPVEFITIVGKSGSGKTTLLRLISGLDTPSDGNILINGESLTGHNDNARVMFQDARLLPWKTVLQNVGLGLKGAWQDKAKKALDHVGLLDRADDWPSILSGGQRQRVALARALASEPPLLLLDEPLGALDALTRIEMQRLIEQLWHEQCFTAILITHDVEEAIVLGDRVVLIEDGQIILNQSITLPRPRHRGDPRFASLKEHILNRVIGIGDDTELIQGTSTHHLAYAEQIQRQAVPSVAGEVAIPNYG